MKILDQLPSWADILPNAIHGVMIGVTILIFVILVLCFLRGLLRGWVKGTYHLVFIGILFIVALVTLEPIANAAGNMNLQGMLGTEFTPPAINGVSVVIPVSSFRETIKAAVEIILKDCFHVTANPIAIANYATAVSVSTVKLFMVLFEGIVILIFGNLLALLFWHILFKFLIGRFKLKHKLRWLSGIQSLVVAVCTMTLIVAPLSATINTLNDHAKIDQSEATNSYVSLAQRVLDAYDTSLFSRVFFSWARPDGSNTMDVNFMNFLTESKMGEETFHIYDEVGAITTAATQAAQLYFGNVFEDGVAWKTLMTSTAEVSTILDSLGQTKIFQTAVPFAIKIAANIDKVIEYIGEDAALDIATMDFDSQQELDYVKDIYVAAVESGGFDFIQDGHSDAPVVLFDNAYDIIFNDTMHAKLKEITQSADKMAIFNRIVTGFLYTQATNNPDWAHSEDPSEIRLNDMLPLTSEGTIDQEKMLEYKWGEELACVIDPLYTIHDANPTGVKDLMDIIMEDVSKPVNGLRHNRIEGETSGEESTSNNEKTNRIVQAVLNLVADGSETVIEAIVGKREADGTPITNELGKSQGTSVMMDSALLTNLMNVIPDFLAARSEQLNEYVGEIDMTASKTVLFADKTDAGIRKAFKKELGTILDVVGDFCKTGEGKALVKDYKNHPGVDIDPDGQFLGIEKPLAQAFKNSIKKLDKSLLAKDIMPSLAHGYAIQNQETLSNIGIEELYFDNANLGQEIASVIDLMIYCPEVVTFAGTSTGNSSLPRIMSLLQNNDASDQLAHALDIIGHCQIINPTSQHNEPIYNIINKLVGGSVDLNLTPEDFAIDDLFSTYDEQGNRLEKGETFYMIEALSTVAASGIVDMMGEMDSMSNEDMLKQFEKIDLESLLGSIGNSKLLRNGFVKILDDNIINKMLMPLELDVEGITFANLNAYPTKAEIAEAWQNEGAALSDIIALANRGLNFNNLDVFGADGATIMEVLKRFSASNIFLSHKDDGSTEYLFPKYFYNKLIDSLKPDSLKYFADEGQREAVSALSEPDLSTKREYTTQLMDNCLSLDQASDWASNGGQIDIFADLLHKVNELGGLDALSKIDAESAPELRATLMVLANSKVVANVVIPNAIEDAIFSIEAENFDFTNANTPYLWSLNDASKYSEAEADSLRKEEIGYICDVMEGLFDTHYGLYDDEGKLDMASMNVLNISTEYFLRPVLEGSLASHVLYEPKDPDVLSVFQLTISTFVKHSGIYGVIDSIYVPISENNSNKYCDFSIEEIIKAISYEDWEEEIDRLVEMMDLAKTTVFINKDDKNIDFNAISDPAKFFGEDVTGKNEQDLRELVTMLNNSTLFYRSLPYHLETAFSSINVLGEGDFQKDIKYANPYYNVKYVEAGSDLKRDQDPYTDTDVNALLDLLKTFGVEASGINMTDITAINPEGVSSLLEQMGKCGIFNYYNDITAPTKALTDHHQGLTSFQGVMVDFLSTDALNEYYYEANNPKDRVHSEDYNDCTSKAVYNVKSMFHDSLHFTQEDINLISGEEGSLRYVLRALTSPELSGIASASGFNVTSLSYESFLSFLIPLNNCPITMDIVPNAIYSMVNGSGDYAMNIEGIKFDRGNYFFSYYWYEDSTGFSEHEDAPIWTNKFYEPELEQLAAIVSFISENKSAIESLAEFKISKIDPYLVRDLLAELSYSYIFHLAGPDERERATPYETNELLNIGGTSIYLNPLSVFHQFMFKLYADSGLAAQAYDTTYDLAYNLTYGSEGYKAKLHRNIKAFENGTLGNSHDGNWLDEIEAFTTDGKRHHGYDVEDTEVGLIETVKYLNDILGGDTLELSTEKFKKLAPVQIRWLLEGLNRLDIVKDALPYSTRSLVTLDDSGENGLGIHKFTTDMLTTTDNPSGQDNVFILSLSKFRKGTYDTPVTSLVLNYEVSQGAVNAGNITINAIFDGGEREVTDYADIDNSVPGKLTIDTSKILSPLRITSDNQYLKFTSTDIYYDTANYLQTQESYKEKDLDAIYYFLASAYRGKNTVNTSNLYFSFDTDVAEDEIAITAFLNESPDAINPKTAYKHSTYGLFNFFLNSNVFGQKFNSEGVLEMNNANVAYLAGDLAIYNLFLVKVPFTNPQTGLMTEETVRLSDNFGDDASTRLDYLTYLNDKRNHYYGEDVSIGIEHALLESAFLDRYMLNAATYQAYIDSSNQAFAMTGNPVDAAYHVVNYALGNSQYDAAADYLSNAMSEEYHNEVHGDYNESTGTSTPKYTISLDDEEVRTILNGNTDPITSPGYIGKSILAGQIEATYKHNIDAISIAKADRTIASPTHPGDNDDSTRLEYLPEQGTFDMYQYVGKGNEGLAPYADIAYKAATLLHDGFAGMSSVTPVAMNATHREVLATDIEAFEPSSNDSLHDFYDAFYLGALYNVLIYRGLFYNVTYYSTYTLKNDFIDMNHPTNFIQIEQSIPFTYEENIDFGYGTVAAAIRQAISA